MHMTEAEYSTWLAQHKTPELVVAEVHRPKARTLPALTEQAEQEMVIQWATFMRPQYPALEWLFHIPNGGQRDAATAAMMQRAGVQPGVPDLCLPVPQRRPDGGHHHGLWIELKRSDHSNSPSAHQKRWLDHLRSAGYLVVVAYGAGEAIAALEHYLGDATNTDHADR